MEERVVLEIPAQMEQLTLARLVASGVGDQLQFSVESIMDAKVALTEACMMLMQEQGCCTLHLEFVDTGNGLKVLVSASGEGCPLVLEDQYDREFSRLMLGTLVEELECSTGCVSFYCRSVK